VVIDSVSIPGSVSAPGPRVTGWKLETVADSSARWRAVEGRITAWDQLGVVSAFRRNLPDNFNLQQG